MLFRTHQNKDKNQISHPRITFHQTKQILKQIRQYSSAHSQLQNPQHQSTINPLPYEFSKARKRYSEIKYKKKIDTLINNLWIIQNSINTLMIA